MLSGGQFIAASARAAPCHFDGGMRMDGSQKSWLVLTLGRTAIPDGWTPSKMCTPPFGHPDATLSAKASHPDATGKAGAAPCK